MGTQEAQRAWFGAARALAAGPADAKMWAQLVALADKASDSWGLAWAAEVALPYLEPLAARLPDIDRVAPARWVLARDTGAPPFAWSLARSAAIVQGEVPSYMEGHGLGHRQIDPGWLKGLTTLRVSVGHDVAEVTLWERLPSSIYALDVSQRGSLRGLGQRAWWPQIKRLTLRGEPSLGRSSLARAHDEGLALSQLEALTLYGGPHTAEELEWVFEQAELEELALCDAKTLRDDVALLLATSPRLKALRVLSFERVQMSAHALWVLGASDALRDVERVSFDNRAAPFWELEARPFLRDLRLLKLKELAFVGCGLSAESVAALEREAPRLSALASLDVRDNQLSPGELRRLKAAYPNARLEVAGCWGEAGLRGEWSALELRAGEKAPPRLLHKLFEEVAPEQLTGLVLDKEATRDLYVEPLVGVSLPRLKRLELTRHNADAAVLGELLPEMLSGGRLEALEVLSLVGWELKFPDEMGRWPQRLRRVTLWSAQLDDRDAAQLIEVLPAGLEVLTLHNNVLTAEAINALRAAMPHTTLHIAHNVGQKVLEALEGDRTLKLSVYDLTTRKGSEAQRRSAAWGRLRRIELCVTESNAYDDLFLVMTGLDTIGRHAHLGGLEELSLINQYTGQLEPYSGLSEASAILSNLPSGLRRLELRGVLHATHIEQFAAELALEALEVLDMRRSGLEARDVALLAEALGENGGLPALRLLEVREGNGVDEAALGRLVRARPGLVIY